MAKRPRWPRWTGTFLRGTALFFGLFSAANSVVMALGARRAEDLWWIDLSGVGGVWGWAAGTVIAVLLVVWALWPVTGSARRLFTSAGCAFIAIVALGNVAGFYRAIGSGLVHALIPVPFSAVVAMLFALLAVVVFRGGAVPSGAKQKNGRLRGRAGVAAWCLVWVLVFPLAQVAFFGTTDYRRPADAAVVLGALVYSNGTLSQSLSDRVNTAVELYEDGLVPKLIMSGGVGSSGVDEAQAMKARAVELGVPAEDVLVDSEGVNTDATVANTTRMLEELGASKALVVSQFYHLPRIKMAYRAAGWNVYTVPASAGRVIGKTPLFVAREIPGFWVYWARAVWRDVVS